MKKSIFIFLGIIIFGVIIFSLNSVVYSKRISKEDQVRVYHKKDNKYAIVILEEDLSEKEIKEKAIEEASELSKDKGYRYFIIRSVEKVKIMLGKTGFSKGQAFPQDMYQREIFKKGTGRDPFFQEEPDTELRDAYQYTIELSREKTRNSIDAY